ncbi:MAG: TolC family protein [Actinomycetota bacterium]|nr:TolC family protein [Actinomycetota bacterium]
MIIAAFLLVLVSGMDANAGTPQPLNYQALSLDDCLSLARQYNPALGGAAEKINELTADYQAAKSQFLPQLSLLSWYERLEPNRLPAGGSTAPPAMDFNKDETFAGIYGKQLIFNGRQTYYSTKSAKIGAEAQRQGAISTGDEVAFGVTQAFYRLLEAKEDVKVAQDALKQRQEFLNLTDAFFKAGKATKLDFFRAKSLVSDATQAVVEAENALTLAREILARTIGLKGQTQVDIQGVLSGEFPPSPGADPLWMEALQNNPELKQLDMEIKQSEAQVKLAKSGYYPEVALQGDIGTRHQDTGGTRGEWLAGVFIQFPFFQGGLTKAQVEAANSRYLQSMDRKRDRLNSLKIDLTTAWQDMENSRNGVADTLQTVATNEEAYASASALYKNGKALGLDVLQAVVDLTASRFSLIRYKAEYEIARARIKQIVGAPFSGPQSPSGIGRSENGGKGK